MYKVVVKITYTLPDGYFNGKDMFIHVFQTEPEARAYILGIREASYGYSNLTIILNGHRVTGADPKQRGG